MSVTWTAENVRFGVMADMWEKMLERRAAAGIKSSRETSVQNKAAIIAFYDECRAGDKTLNLYPVIRLLVPEMDDERSGQLRLKEVSLGQAYIQLFNLDSKSTEALNLQQRNQQTNHAEQQHAGGLFSQRLFKVVDERTIVGKRVNNTSSLTVADVNRQLDKLKAIAQGSEMATSSNTSSNQSQSNASQTTVSQASQVASSSQTQSTANRINAARKKTKRERIIEVLRFFQDTASAVEIKWIASIIVNDMRTCIADSTILSAYHPKSVEWYKYKNNLRALCSALKDITSKVDKLRIELGSPFSAMHLKKTLPCDVVKLMGNEEFYVEEKLDGHRMFMHFDHGSFKYYSRHGTDFSNEYGKTKLEKMSQKIYMCVTEKNPENLILDGEMMAYDLELKTVVSMGSHSSGEGGRLPETGRKCFVLFDILYLNGEDLTGYPLKERRQILKDTIGEKEGWLHILKYDIGKTMDDVIGKLEEVLSEKGEGICVKNPMAHYYVGARGNSWLKLKPDYFSELGEFVDAIIVGASYGRSVRLLGHFVCAVRNGDRWVAFTRVGTGFSLDIRRKMNSILKPMAVPYFAQSVDHSTVGISRRSSGTNNRQTNVPDWLSIGNERPEVLFLDPDQCIMVQIKASEIVRTVTFESTWTLRFPRMVSLHEGKPNSEATTLEQLAEMAAKKGQTNMQLMRRNGDPVADGKKSAKSFSLRAPKISVSNISAEYRPLKKLKPDELADADQQYFAGMICAVKSKTASHTVNALKEMLQKGGATIHAMPTKDTQFVFVGERNVNTKHIVNWNRATWANPDAKPELKPKKLTAKAALKAAAKAPHVHKYEVLNASWILDCLKKKKNVRFLQQYWINVSDALKKMAQGTTDEYGDAFDEEFDDATFKLFLQDMKPIPTWKDVKKKILKTADNGDDMESLKDVKSSREFTRWSEENTFTEVAYPLSTGSVLRPCKAHVLGIDKLGSFGHVSRYVSARRIRFAQLLLESLGARVVDEINLYGVTHIVCIGESKGFLQLKAIKKWISDNGIDFNAASRVNVVSEEWLTKCDGEKSMLNEAPFRLL